MALLDFLVTVFTEYDYLAVFCILLICGFGVPVPEDVTLVAGGVIAGLGYADVNVMVAVCMAGVLIGDGTMFLIGYFAGSRALEWRWVNWLLTPRRYAQVQQKYARYGNRMLFVARFLPGLRAPIFLTAGMSHRISFLQFLLMDGAAALISVPAWVYLGFHGAENHEWLLTWLQRGEGVVWLLAMALLAALGVYLWRRRQRQARLDQLRRQRSNRRR